MTPSEMRSGSIRAPSVSTLPRPFWTVAITPSGARIRCATSAAHVVPYVFMPTTATRIARRLDHLLRTPRLGQRALQRCALGLLHRERMLRVREGPLADLAVVLLQRLDDRRPEVGVPLRELRLEIAEQAEDVVEDQDLAVAVASRPDPDRRDAHALRGHRRHGRGHGLDDDREAASLLEADAIVDELPRRGRALRLHLEAAELRDALRREPDVTHDRDAVLDERTHGVDDLVAALELHRVHAGLLEEARRVAQRVLAAGLVRAERHVADEHRVLRAA